MNKLLQGLVSLRRTAFIKPSDIFAILNISLFVGMCYVAYFDRFVRDQEHEYIEEFFVYAIVVILLILFIWKVARHFPVPGWLLVLTQLGIVMHFAGGLALFNDGRLYDLIIMGVRYDKYVHFFNAIVAAVYVQRILWVYAQKHTLLSDLLTILVVLGLGACVEIIEYLVMLMVRVTGVGSYDNNLQDIIANLTGVTLYVLGARLIQQLKPSSD